MSDRITFLTDHDLFWGFDGQGPIYYIKVGDWPRSQLVDPFPCYSHNKHLVISEVEHAEKTLPLKFKPKYFILSHECPSRTNGWATENEVHSSDEKAEKVLAPYIVLAGKRIPIMPSMTRYLVSHEYSHIVDYHMRIYLKKDGDAFRSDYAKMRGIKKVDGYGGRTWHLSVGEVIANDIRIALLNRETEFWPHDCKHPLEEPAIVDYWMDAKQKYFTQPV